MAVQFQLQIGGPGLIHTSAVHGLGTGFLQQLRKHLAGFPPTQYQVGAKLGQLALQRLQAVMQPPAAGRTGLPLSGALVVEYVAGYDGLAGGGSGS